MTTVHKNLTGADLHESKGVDTALSGTVYVANGSGSGTWTDASTIITNTAFTTGDAKLTFKTSADTGWVLCNDGTIGDGSSGATTRANADTQDLFNLLYALSVGLSVSGGRGASAAADYAAHKTIALPAVLGRALVIAGTGSGLTARTLASTFGAETVTMVRANLPQTSVSVTITDPGHTHRTDNVPAYSTNQWNPGGGAASACDSSVQNITTTSSTTGITAAFNLNGNVSQTAMAIMQPSVGINVMVKL